MPDLETPPHRLPACRRKQSFACNSEFLRITRDLQSTLDMKIGFDYRIFGTQKYGGISRYFVELASRIQHYPDTSVQVIAPFYRNNFLSAKRDSVPILGTHYSSDSTRVNAIIHKADFILSRILFAAYRPQIVHETYYSPHRIANSSAKLVITVYDMIEELFPNFFPSSSAKKTRSVVFARADHLICISESTRADLIRLYGVDPLKVSVVHLASSLTMSQRPPISIGDPFFLYVGDRWGYKNFLGLLAAFSESLLYKTHKLLCFGGGKLRTEELRTIAKLGIPMDRIITIAGDDDMLSRCYSAAEAFVYPSLYEGFGIPLLEAMECGCPVLCGDLSSMPEVAGEAAIYFSANDIQSMTLAMLKLTGSNEERSKLIRKGHERVKRFSWDICAQQTHAIYKRLLSSQ